jgi:hypothetical protein
VGPTVNTVSPLERRIWDTSIGTTFAFPFAL